MKNPLETLVPRIITELTTARLVLPKTLARTRRPRARGPVPIPFYGGPAAHSHDHVEIALVLQGPLYCEMERRGTVVQPGSVMLFPPRVMHYDSYVSPETPYTVLWFTLWPGHPRMNVSRYTAKAGFELVRICDVRHGLVAEDDWAFVASFAANRRPPLERFRELLFALYAATLEAVRQLFASV